MDYKALILERKSVRDYKTTPIKSDILNEIKGYSTNCKKLIEGIETDILILDNSEAYDRLQHVAGYKGNMINSPHYIIILSEPKDYFVENSGYIGEGLILKACELGVDSCWITFEDSSKIIERLDLNTNKTVTGIIALGYDANTSKTKVVGNTKTGDNSSKSNINVAEDKKSFRLEIEEIVFIKEWGINASAEELKNRMLLYPFQFALMAPSTLNRQPWRFILDDGTVILAVRNDEHTNTYEERIDAGIVMLYFEVVVDSTMFDLKWNMGTTQKDYKIPNDFAVVAHCNV